MSLTVSLTDFYSSLSPAGNCTSFNLSLRGSYLSHTPLVLWPHRSFQLIWTTRTLRSQPDMWVTKTRACFFDSWILNRADITSDLVPIKMYAGQSESKLTNKWGSPARINNFYSQHIGLCLDSCWMMNTTAQISHCTLLDEHKPCTLSLLQAADWK